MCCDNATSPFRSPIQNVLECSEKGLEFGLFRLSSVSVHLLLFTVRTGTYCRMRDTHATVRGVDLTDSRGSLSSSVYVLSDQKLGPPGSSDSTVIT